MIKTWHIKVAMIMILIGLTNVFGIQINVLGDSNKYIESIIKEIKVSSEEINYRQYYYSNNEEDKIKQSNGLILKYKQYCLFDNLIKRKSCLDSDGIIEIEVFEYKDEVTACDEIIKLKASILNNMTSKLIKSKSNEWHIRDYRGLNILFQNRTILIYIKSNNKQDNEIYYLLQKIKGVNLE